MNARDVIGKMTFLLVYRVADGALHRVEMVQGLNQVEWTGGDDFAEGVLS